MALPPSGHSGDIGGDVGEGGRMGGLVLLPWPHTEGGKVSAALHHLRPCFLGLREDQG